MKTIPFLYFAFSLAATLEGFGQEPVGPQPDTATETEKTPEAPPAEEVATGRVFSVEPTALLVTPANVSIPLTFAYNVKTPLMDEVEKPVLWDQIRNGLPVTVHYETNGDKLIATKVIVTRKMLTGGETTEPEQAARKREMLAEIKRQKAIEATERAKALPAAAGGTIMGFEQVIVVRSPDSTDVVQYVVNNSTLYVDSTGQPVPLQFVRTGVPVNIQYVEDAGRRIATQFVLERVPRGAREAIPATVTRPNPTSGNPSTAAGRPTTVDENGNIVTGVLEDGFVNPPVTVLPSASQPDSDSNRNAPKPNEPGTPQPGVTPPGTQPPGASKPGSTTPPARPGTPTGPTNGNPGSSPGSPEGTSPAPAPAR